jgi:hypothetical protein
MGTQLSHWVSRELGIAYHPHLIRKIMPKLYLDADPWRSSAACWAIRPTRCCIGSIYRVCIVPHKRLTSTPSKSDA